LRVVAKASASSSARRAKPSAADRHPEQVERLHRDLETLAEGAEQIGADAVKLEPGKRMGRDNFDPLGHRKAGIVGANDKGGNAACSVLSRAGAGEDG